MAERAVKQWLGEDRSDQDVTSRAVIPDGAEGRAWIEAKQPCVVAGLDSAVDVLEADDVALETLVEDGQRVEAGQRLLEAEGPAHDFLARERAAVNVLAHLSGIATATREVVDRVDEAGADCEVLATRKTTPGLRELEHEAVEAGGGAPHRRDLGESILVKENHLSFVTVEEAVESAQRNAAGTFLMVEAETADEAREVARAGADGVLLDNVDADGLGDLVELLKQIDPTLTVEASGGITAGTVADYAPHVDRVSLGSLTHSASAADLSMRVEPA